jgi:hypothetical protein
MSVPIKSESRRMVRLSEARRLINALKDFLEEAHVDPSEDGKVEVLLERAQTWLRLAD